MIDDRIHGSEEGGEGETEVLPLLRSEIGEHGAISFARFMELALYAPGVGYYERPGRVIGRKGDFYTSVSVGPAFGFLVALGWAGFLSGLDHPEWVEAAAHDGQWARDVLEALDRFRPDLARRLRYRIIEPSPTRRAVQQRHLASFGDRVEWLPNLAALVRPVNGVIVSNELLDAFPLRRFAWRAGSRTWVELGVTLRDGRLEECDLPASCPWPTETAAALQPMLPEGFVVERCPGADSWWNAAADCLGTGALVAFDYGHGEGEVLRPERTRGTARAYRNHRWVGDLLARPGEQDLTAHVDFPRLREIGEACGLGTLAFQPQGRWLGGVATKILGESGDAAGWLTERARQFQSLTHPGLLGAAMKMLAQGRGDGLLRP